MASKRGDGKRQRGGWLSRYWRTLPSDQRAAYIGVVGVIVAAVFAGLCGLVAGLMPVVLPTIINPTPTMSPSLRITGIRLDDWRLSSLYGIADGQGVPTFATNLNHEAKRQMLYSQGYHVLYVTGDFSALRLPPDVLVAVSTISTTSAYPTVNFSFELWNLDEDFPVIIDEITVKVTDYTSPTPGSPHLLFLVGPDGGGSSEWQRQEFEVSLSAGNRTVQLLKELPDRLAIESQDVLEVLINMSFRDPGRYRFVVTVDYHTPTETPETYDLDEYVYSWMVQDHIDGSAVTVVR